jgi:hypothetical protein
MVEWLNDIAPLLPRPYGFDRKDRKVLGFIQTVKIPSRQRRSISQAFDILYEDSLYLVHHFVYLKRKITFYTWEIVLAILMVRIENMYVI